MKRRGNGSGRRAGEIHFHVPGLKHYETDEFAQRNRLEFVAISGLQGYVEVGIAFDRERLLKLAWGFDFYGQTRTVDVHVAQLRKKLHASRVKIETVPGVGYKLVI